MQPSHSPNISLGHNFETSGQSLLDDTDAESTIADEEEVHASVHYTSCWVYAGMSAISIFVHCSTNSQTQRPLGTHVLFEHMSYTCIVLAGCTTGEGH